MTFFFLKKFSCLKCHAIDTKEFFFSLQYGYAVGFSNPKACNVLRMQSKLFRQRGRVCRSFAHGRVPIPSPRPEQ